LNPSKAHLEEVAREATAILESARALPPGWVVVRAERDPGTGLPAVRLHLESQDGGRGVILSWAEHGGAPFDGFRVGDRYGAAYLRGADAWDLKDAATPEAIRRLAFGACTALGDATEGPGLDLAPAAEPPPQESLPFGSASILQLLSPHLVPGAELCDGWRLVQAVSPHGAEVQLLFERPDTPVTLRFVLMATDSGDPGLRGLQILAFPRMGIHRPWILESHESALCHALEQILRSGGPGRPVIEPPAEPGA
jgi:hypothetical protein